FTPVESAAPPPSACPLRHSRRWALAGSHPLDSLPREILPPQGSAGGSLSRKIRRRPQTGFPEWSAQLPGQPEASCATQDLRCLVAATPPARLGGVLETSLRWSRICPAISRPLYPSRGHLQPSPSLFQRWPGYVSLARFGAPQSTEAQSPADR